MSLLKLIFLIEFDQRAYESVNIVTFVGGNIGWYKRRSMVIASLTYELIVKTQTENVRDRSDNQQ